MDSLAVFRAVADFTDLDRKMAVSTKNALALKAAMSGTVASAAVPATATASVAAHGSAAESAALSATALGAGVEQASTKATKAEKSFSNLALSTDKVEQSLKAGAASSKEAEGVLGELGAVIGETELSAQGLEHGFEQLWTNIARGRLAVGGLAIGILTAASAIAFLGVEYNRTRQQQDLAFTALQGNQEQAHEYVTNLEDTAHALGLSSDAVVQAAQQLEAAGFSADQILKGAGADATGLIKDIGDTAAAQGPRAAAAFNSIVSTLTRVESTGKLTDRTLTTIGQAGVPVQKILQQQLGLTASQVSNITDAGVSATAVLSALDKGMQETFAGAGAKNAETLHGTLLRIKDDLGQGAGGAITKLSTDVTQLLTKWAHDFESLDEEIEQNGFLNTLEEKAPGTAQLVNGVKTTVQQLVQLLKDGEPVATGFFQGFAVAREAGLDVVFKVLDETLTAVLAILKEIPAPLLQAVGFATALALAFKALTEIKLFGTAVTSTKALLTQFGLLSKSTEQQTVEAKAMNVALEEQAKAAATLAQAKEILAQATTEEALAEARATAATEADTAALMANAAAAARASGAATVGVASSGLNAGLAPTIASVQAAQAARDVSVAEEQLAARTAAVSAATETAAATTGGFAAGLRGLLPAIGPTGFVVIGLAGLVTGYKLLHDYEQKARDSQIDASDAATQAAKSLNLELTAIKNVNAEADKATVGANVSGAAFADQNESEVKLLQSLKSPAAQKAELVQVGYSLVNRGTSMKDTLDAISKMAQAADIKVPVGIEKDINAQGEVNALVTQVQDAIKKGVSYQKGNSGILGDLKAMVPFLPEGTNDLGAKTDQDFKNLGKQINTQFVQTGNYGQAFAVFAQLQDAISKSSLNTLNMDQAITDVKNAADLANPALAGYNAELNKLTASGMSFSDAVAYINKNMPELTKDLDETKASASGLSSVVDSMAQEMQGAAIGTGQLGNEITALQSTFESTIQGFGSAATVYSNLQQDLITKTANSTKSTITKAQQSIDAAFNAQDVAANQKYLQMRQDQQNKLSSLEKSGASDASVQALKDQQRAQTNAADAALQSLHAQQNAQDEAAKAAQSAASTTKSAADKTQAAWQGNAKAVAASVTQVYNSLKKQDDDLQKFEGNLRTIAVKYGADISNAVQKMDPTGEIAAQLAGGKPGDQATQKLVDEIQRNIGLTDTGINTLNGQDTGNYNTDTNAIKNSIQSMIFSELQESGGSRTVQQIQNDIVQQGLSISQDDILKITATYGSAADQAWSAAQTATLQGAAGIAGQITKGFQDNQQAVVSAVQTYVQLITQNLAPLWVELAGGGIAPAATSGSYSGLPIVPNSWGGTTALGVPSTLSKTGKSIPEGVAKPPAAPSSSTANKTSPTLTVGPNQGAGPLKPGTTATIPNPNYKAPIIPHAFGAFLPNSATIQPETPNLVQWAEPGTGGEAFIPLKGNKSKSLQIWAQVGKALGVGGSGLAPFQAAPAGSSGLLGGLRSGSGLSVPSMIRASSKIPSLSATVTTVGRGVGGDQSFVHTDAWSVTVGQVVTNDPEDMAVKLQRIARLKALTGEKVS